MLEQSNVGRIADCKFSLRDPVLAQSRNFAVSGEFQWITCNTVYPCIPDLTGKYGQRLTMRFDCIRNFSQARGSNLSIRKLSTQRSISLANFFWWVRASIVVGYNYGD